MQLSVVNKGSRIPTSVAERLFEPFYRAPAGTGHKGLGLGLYIAAEIARAHGGDLKVSSGDDETRFMLSIPVDSRRLG